MFGENIGASDDNGEDNSNTSYDKHVNNGAKGAFEEKARDTGGGGEGLNGNGGGNDGNGGGDSGNGNGERRERRRRWLTDIVMGHHERNRIRCFLLDVSKWYLFRDFFNGFIKVFNLFIKVYAACQCSQYTH